MKFLANLPLVSASKLASARNRHDLPTVALLLCLPWLAAPAKSAIGQEPAASQPQQAPSPATPAATTSAPAASAPAAPTQAAPAQASPATTTPVQAQPSIGQSGSQSGEITEEELKQRLVGKQLFLRGGYLGDSLSFTERGLPVGHPTVGSYTLSGVEIDKVHLTKHKVQLEGARYALHFLGALPYEDPSTGVDRVKITPKKKVLRISIDREQIVKEKKAKENKKSGKEKAVKPSKAGSSPAEIAKEDVASSETDVAQPAPAQEKPEPATAQPAAAPAESATNQAPSPAPDQASTQAAEDAADKPADEASVTTTTSPMHAARMLRDALDRIFATGLDDKVKQQMPDFWQLYYQAQAAGVDYRPRDPAVLRSNAVDSQAKVLTSIAPDSNEYAQASGIAGRALYRAVIGADGRPTEIAVVRPIGFGLDEKAVEAIRKATFQPAVKANQPVAETLDLTVLFRIYSKRTSVAASADAKSGEPIKPGPYTVQAQKQQQQQ